MVYMISSFNCWHYLNFVLNMLMYLHNGNVLAHRLWPRILNLHFSLAEIVWMLIQPIRNGVSRTANKNAFIYYAIVYTIEAQMAERFGRPTTNGFEPQGAGSSPAGTQYFLPLKGLCLSNRIWKDTFRFDWYLSDLDVLVLLLCN